MRQFKNLKLGTIPKEIDNDTSSLVGILHAGVIESTVKLHEETLFQTAKTGLTSLCPLLRILEPELEFWSCSKDLVACS